MLFVNKLKVLTLMTCLVLVGQGFAQVSSQYSAPGSSQYSAPGSSQSSAPESSSSSKMDLWTDYASQPSLVGGYYEIYKPEQLAWISLQTKGGGSSYNVKLMNDIDLAGKLWLPICAGNHNTGWGGTFNGNGHVISNLYIRGAELISAYNENTYAQNVAFIAVLTNGKVKNLTLENVNIYATNNKGESGGGDEISVGALVAYKTKDKGMIDSIRTSGSINVSGKSQGVGGVVGNAHSSTIQNSISSVNIYSSGDSAFIGGIVGLVKNNTVQISSCVYAGETLLNTGEGGSVGAVIGKVYKGSATASTTNVFYDTQKFESGIGLIDPKTGHVDGTITPVSDLNSEEVICKLNGGTWNAGTCSGDTSSVWAVGISGVSLNGSDGFKITFNANGGTFPVGAKTSKTLLLGKTIIADEIGIPTHESLSFAGWSLNKDAVDPDENLGTVNGPDTVYAVWYPYYDVTFASTSGVLNGTTIVKKIAKNDNVNINDIVFPDPYEHCDETDENGTCLKTTMLYFTGWTQKVLDNPEESYIIGKGVSYSDTIHVEDIKVTSDVTIYSVWTAVPTYTVTYDANGHGRTWVDYVQVEEGQSVTSPENPVADPGYKFVAWYTEPECNNTFGFGTSITKNETLYAGWELESYSITYDLDKGTNDDDNPSSYDVTTPTIVFKKPTREGYSFDGWFYDKGFTMRATQITQGTAEDITIYAKWEINTYSIVYMSGTSVSGTSVADKKDWGETITLKGAVDEFYREGYVQDGWSVEDGGELTYKVGASYSENKNLVLYPHWVVAYTISYLPGDGEGITGERANDIKAEGYDFDMPGETFFREGDYEQNGWINSATDEEIDLEAKYTADADATFYPRWALKTYTITYLPGEGEGITGEVEAGTKTINVDFTLSSETFTRDGYTQDGWMTTEDGDAVEYAFGATYTYNAAITLYPHWVINTYTAEYDLDGGSMEGAESFMFTIESGDIDLATPTKNGYTFDGWLDDVTSDVVTVLPAGSIGNRTLTAQWSVETYSIVYHNIEGATFETANPTTYTVEDEFPIALNRPSKTGFNFLGWSLVENSTDYVAGIAAGSKGDANFYANWELAPSPITVTASSGSFEYDGETHNATCSYEGVIPVGYSIAMVPSGSVQNVSQGEVSTSCAVTITDESGDDVTDLFTELTIVDGTISVAAKAVPYGAVTIYTDETGNRAVIDGTSSEAVSITDKDNVVVNAVTFNRTFPVNGEGENKMSTLTLPFSIEKSKVSGAEFYELNDVVGTKVRIWKSLDVLEANTPYIIRTTADHLTFTLDEGEKLTLNTEKMNNSKSSDGLWEIRGVYEYKQWTEGDEELGLAYGYTATATNNLSVGKFAKNGIGAYIKPLRAYLLKTPEKQAQKARRMLAKSIASISDDTDSDELDVEIVDRETGETTIIGKLNKATGEIKIIDNWYDMKGRSLNAKPTAKGIYYFNGKRVMVK